ncbi:COMM domain-containing protein 3-like [Osmia bicornis bicornis]|uniref:COMM domain-containing protein 3-like n=1 Tax=Osmia bicornis bicornis TaxID=1437191 RepID=UPI001EAEB4FD|nr:COMM domain-containing protein 3-like [Osmia bicornis bicornis]
MCRTDDNSFKRNPNGQGMDHKWIMNGCRKFKHDNFQQILDTAISYISESPAEIRCTVKAANLKPILTKKIVADTACLFIEAARHDLDEENLKTFLCQISSDEQRIKKLCERYVNNKTTIQCHLESIGNNPPHIVDVDWHLDYCVKLDTCNSLGVPLYHVRFSTKEGETMNHVTFSCTIQQLQELVFKLKDAIRYSEKLTNV